MCCGEQRVEFRLAGSSAVVCDGDVDAAQLRAESGEVDVKVSVHVAQAWLELLERRVSGEVGHADLLQVSVVCGCEEVLRPAELALRVRERLHHQALLWQEECERHVRSVRCDEHVCVRVQAELLVWGAAAEVRHVSYDVVRGQRGHDCVHVDDAATRRVLTGVDGHTQRSAGGRRGEGGRGEVELAQNERAEATERLERQAGRASVEVLVRRVVQHHAFEAHARRRAGAVVTALPHHLHPLLHPLHRDAREELVDALPRAVADAHAGRRICASRVEQQQAGRGRVEQVVRAERGVHGQYLLVELMADVEVPFQLVEGGLAFLSCHPQPVVVRLGLHHQPRLVVAVPAGHPCEGRRLVRLLLR